MNLLTVSSMRVRWAAGRVGADWAERAADSKRMAAESKSLRGTRMVRSVYMGWGEDWGLTSALEELLTAKDAKKGREDRGVGRARTRLQSRCFRGSPNGDPITGKFNHQGHEGVPTQARKRLEWGTEVF